MPTTEIGARVEADHKRLRLLSAELTSFMRGAMIASDFVLWKLTALDRLRDFQNQLAKHFDLEEDGGFIDDLLRLSPESSNSIMCLVEEHGIMMSELVDIIAMVKAYTRPGEVDLPKARERVDAFLSDLKRHESSETALLYDAHYQVNGAGD